MESKQVTTIQVPVALLKAAGFFKGKNDVRYYLNGVHLNPDGYVEATNGHVAYRALLPAGFKFPRSVILQIDGSIPAKALVAELVLIDDELSGLVRFYDRNDKPVNQVRGFRILEGKYPDLDRVIPSGDLEAVTRIGVRAEYMAFVDKAGKAMGMGHTACLFKLRGDKNVIEVSLDAPEYKAIVLIMPCKFADEEAA